jgi:hypothetical protein
MVTNIAIQWLILVSGVFVLSGGWTLLAALHFRFDRQWSMVAVISGSLLVGFVALFLSLHLSQVMAVNITTPWAPGTWLAMLLAFGPAVVSHALWITRVVRMKRKPEQPCPGDA